MDYNDNDDYEDYYMVTKEFCEKYDIPYNESAAHRSATSHNDMFKALKTQDFNNEEEILNAFTNRLKVLYLDELSKVTN